MQLVISNLSKRYPNGVQALSNVSLIIPQGMFGLLGPNGAGKSSLMRTIATLQEADSGSIMLDDLDVLKEKETVRKILGYLPQDFGVYPKISAEEMLNHIAQLKCIHNAGERKETVQGMKQRFGIAQALMGQPKLIIVDEPTAGLDPAERNRFYNLLSEIGENTIVILSTHIVEDVRTLCSDFAIICKGELMRHDQPDEAVSEMNGRIFSKSIAKTDIDQYKEAYEVISVQMKSGQLSLRIYSETEPGNGFTPVAPVLEDVYFHQIAGKMDLITL
jgi:ABC-2 type transport system ATP-binding protein